MGSSDVLIRSWMLTHCKEYKNKIGEINTTALANAACHELEKLSDTPEHYFDIALDIFEEMEET